MEEDKAVRGRDNGGMRAECIKDSTHVDQNEKSERGSGMDTWRDPRKKGVRAGV